nr:zinc ABC transporter substrate-binding protein [Pseudomaricurvus sp. HS19]
MRAVLIVFLLLGLAGTAVAEPLRLVASVRPLALLAQSVAGDGVEIVTLMEPGVTPHDFAFRVSHRRALAQADLVLWVGPELEPYLQAPLASKRQLSLQALESRPQAEDHGTGRAGGEAGHHDHSHGDEDHDPHLWLSRTLAVAMLSGLAETLAELDPPQASNYRQRAQQQIASLQQLALQAGSQPARPYAMAHAALGALVEEFRLPAPLLLSASPEIAPGARRLWQLQQQLQPGDCLLVEWPGPRAWQQQLAAAHGYRQPVIDLMGYDEEVSDYYELLSRLLGQVQDCVYGFAEKN